MDEKAVEDKYRPFWQAEDSQSSPESPSGDDGASELLGDTSGVETSGRDKSFFEDMPTYIEGTKSDSPNVSRKKKVKNSFKSGIKIETYNDKPGLSLSKILPAMITIVVFCIVGSVLWSTIMNTPEIKQQMNSTGIIGITNSAAFKVIPIIAILAMGIILLGASGLLRGGSRGD